MSTLPIDENPIHQSRSTVTPIGEIVDGKEVYVVTLAGDKGNPTIRFAGNGMPYVEAEIGKRWGPGRFERVNKSDPSRLVYHASNPEFIRERQMAWNLHGKNLKCPIVGEA